MGAVKESLASAVWIALLLGVFQLLLFLGLVFSGKLRLLLGIEEGSLSEYSVALAMLILVGCWASFGSVAGVLVRVYAPFGRFAEAQWIGVFQRLAQFLLLIGVAVSGGFLLSYSIAFWVFSAVFALIWFPHIRRRFSDLYPWWRGGSWKVGFRNLSHSTVLTANGIVQQAGMNGLPLLVASQFTAAAVPVFTTLRTVSNTFSQASLILINPLVPDIVRLHVREEWEKLSSLFRACWFGGGVVINLGLVVAAPFVPWLYEVWTHGKLGFDGPLFALLAAAVAIRSAAAPLTAYIAGLNHLRAVSVANILQTGLAVGVPLLFAKSWGLVAFGLGVVLGEIVGLAVYFFYATHFSGASGGVLRRVFLREAVLPVLGVGAALLAIGADVSFALPVAGIIFVALAVSYAHTWTRLPPDLKLRLLRLLPARLRTKFVADPPV